MKRKLKSILMLFLGLVTICWAGPALADKILLVNGAGATFPYPLYSKWFYEYAKINPAVNFNYQAIGSGGGIKQLQAGVVDFGASDAPMTDQQIKDCKGLVFHLPMVGGAVAMVYNLPEVKGVIKLTPDLLAAIYLGQIKQWSDPRLVKLNPELGPVKDGIIVCRRADGSGTSFIFTDYLSSVSSAWAKRVGKGTAVNWPVGLGGKGNPGVAGLVKQNRGSIGYVELAYARQNKLPYASIQNKSGNFLEPTLEGTTAAMNGTLAQMPADFRVSLVNAAGRDSYPIVGLTWILVYQNQTDPVKAGQLVKFLRWALTDGQKLAPALDYAPLAPSLAEKVQRLADQIKY